MATKKNIIKLFISIAIILALSVIFSYSTDKFKNKQNLKAGIINQQNEAPELTAQQRKENKALKNADYIFARPHTGPLAQTKKIKLSYQENDTATATLKDSNKIKIKQDVILFDKEGAIMPLGGKVIEVTPQEGNVNIKIQLPKNTKTKHLSNTAEIITLETIASQRLPHTALQHDKNDNGYVWTVEKTEKEGRFKAIKTWIENPTIGRNYLIAGDPINGFKKIILEPDRKIKNGDIYDMVETRINAPLFSPIKQAFHDYETYTYQQARNARKEKAAACGQNLQSKGTAETNQSSVGCGVQLQQKLTPEEIFDSILSRQPGGNGTSGACNSCGG